jgi:7-cyano-7-deazaguanine reductase
MTTESSYEGKQNHIRDLNTPEIEVFENIYSDKDYVIDLEIPEFTAICPKTGLPDFGTVFISYSPAASCLELKSLKEYFTFFRNVGIFHENVVNKAIDDIVKACSPRWIELRAEYNVRGGITTSVSRIFDHEMSNAGE